jgi:hypothetical protein
MRKTCEPALANVRRHTRMLAVLCGRISPKEVALKAPTDQATLVRAVRAALAR